MEVVIMTDTKEIAHIASRTWRDIVQQCKTDGDLLLVCSELYATAITFKHNNLLIRQQEEIMQHATGGIIRQKGQKNEDESSKT